MRISILGLDLEVDLEGPRTCKCISPFGEKEIVACNICRRSQPKKYRKKKKELVSSLKRPYLRKQRSFSYLHICVGNSHHLYVFYTLRKGGLEAGGVQDRQSYSCVYKSSNSIESYKKSPILPMVLVGVLVRPQYFPQSIPIHEYV